MTKVPGRAETYDEKAATTRVLRAAWHLAPQLRLGQLIVNAIGDVDLFNVEDDELVRLVAEFVKEHG